MSVERLTIVSFLQQSRHALLLDVRSPAEYKHAHIPGAVSLPLFTDEERKVVGTTYKQVSREQAIKIGLDYFGPKMRSMVEIVERLVKERSSLGEGTTANNQETKTNILVYCWRGGMRSGAVSWLLNLYGFKVQVLNDGYKTFRRWAIETAAYPYRLNIIGGFTGSGKTELIAELEKRGEPVVNLEALAQHKGSAFGNIDMPPQPSQEMFENLLALDISRKYEAAKAESNPQILDGGLTLWPHKPIWIEDESQRIGHVNIPNDFWNNMRRSPVYFIEIPFEERLTHLVEEYGCLDKELMKGAIERISKRLGYGEAKKAVELLQQGQTAECFRILLKYYDKHYLKALHNRENFVHLLNKIPCNSVDKNNIQSLLPKPIIA